MVPEGLNLDQMSLAPPPPTSTPTPPVTDADLLAVYAQYPRKEGKAKGMSSLRGQIRDRHELELLTTAVANYAALVTAEEREQRYILHFSTFAGRWRDYLEIELPSRNVRVGHYGHTGKEKYRGGIVEDF